MALKLTNNAVSTLPASITSGATTLSVQGGDAGKFPVLGAGDWHPATIIDPSNNMEIVRVTARAGSTLTIVRAQEGTTAKAFAAGSRIDVRVTAETIGSIVDDYAALNSGKANKGGEVFTGGVTVPTFAINGLDNQDQVLMFQKGGVSRFSIFVDSLGTFNMGKYADDGNWNGGILSINRQSGKMTLAEQLIALKGIDVRGNATFLNEVLAPTFVVKENPGNFSILRWLRGNLPAFDISLNPAQDFQLNTFANDGTFLFNPLYISRLTGVTTINNIRLGNKATAADITAATENKFPDAKAVKEAIAANVPPSLGVAQSWQDVAASRSLGTVYQNTTGRTIAVAVYTSYGTSFEVSTNGTTFLQLGYPIYDATSGGTSTSMVANGPYEIPPGNYYRVIGGVINSWKEMR